MFSFGGFFEERRAVTFLSNDLVWWITVVDFPAMASLFWMIWRTRHNCDVAVEQVQDVLDVRNNQLRDALFSFKLEVAKTYASQKDLKDLETRIVEHLLRIEAKLDRTELKAEALSAQNFKNI